MIRTALLIRCGADEADRIRFEAQKEHRTISDYVLRISAKAVAADDSLFSKPNYDPTNESSSTRSRIVAGQRTSILVRCAVNEADRIRESARRRDIPINAFVLQALKSDWNLRVPLHVSASAAASPLGG